MEKNKVLVVDDEKSILIMLKLKLSKLNFKVSTALSGKEAMAKLRQDDYDFVLTDINMPDGSGIDLLKFAKSHANGTQVIGMSGTPWVMQGHDFDATLGKPFDLNEFQGVVRALKDRLDALRPAPCCPGHTGDGLGTGKQRPGQKRVAPGPVL